MIQLFLLNIETVWIMFMKILMAIIKKKRRVLIIFDDMISHVMTNKKAQSMLKNCLLAVEN